MDPGVRPQAAPCPSDPAGPPGLPAGRPGFRFRAFERLKQNEGIRKVFKSGRAYSCPGAKLFVLKNGLPHNRVAFTLARKFGGAPERNRAKRLGREAYRLLRPGLSGGFDLVLLVYPPGPPPGGGGASSGPGRRIGLAFRLRQLKRLFTLAGLNQDGN